jgi:FixJ family two-component response regulator
MNPRGEPGLIFVVDDDLSVRRSMARLLISYGYQVETFDSAAQYFQRERHPGIGCILTDLRMPEIDGLQFQARLATAGHHFPVIFLTAHGTVPHSVSAMKAGAVDFLLKPFTPEQLLSVIDRALRHHAFVRETHGDVAGFKQRLATLSAREYQVFERVCLGELNKEIAARLGTVEKTIKVHRGRMIKKLKVRSVAELVRLAERAGISKQSHL